MSHNESDGTSPPEPRTEEEAMANPRPEPPHCPKCSHEFIVDELEACRTPAWQSSQDLVCPSCEWTGTLVAETIGQLMPMFNAVSVADLARMIDDAQWGDDETFIFFDEGSQEYFLGSHDYIVELLFPQDPRKLMAQMDEIEELHLAELQRQSEQEEAELAAEEEAELKAKREAASATE